MSVRTGTGAGCRWGPDRSRLIHHSPEGAPWLGDSEVWAGCDWVHVLMGMQVCVVVLLHGVPAVCSHMGLLLHTSSLQGSRQDCFNSWSKETSGILKKCPLRGFIVQISLCVLGASLQVERVPEVRRSHTSPQQHSDFETSCPSFQRRVWFQTGPPRPCACPNRSLYAERRDIKKSWACGDIWFRGRRDWAI